jgi:hypothetical protein
MFGDLLGGLVDKEQITHDTIQDCLDNIAEELGCSYKDFFVMIKPTDETFTMRFYIYKFENGVPKLVREISLKEVLGLTE